MKTKKHVGTRIFALLIVAAMLFGMVSCAVPQTFYQEGMELEETLKKDEGISSILPDEKEESSVPEKEEVKEEAPSLPKNEEVKEEAPSAPKNEEAKEETPSLPKNEEVKEEVPSAPKNEEVKEETPSVPEKEEEKAPTVSDEVFKPSHFETENVAQNLKALLEEVSEDSTLTVSGIGAFDESVLFGVNTLFNEAGKKIRIVIDGQNEATLSFSADRLASANDITFKNLTFDFDGEFFAGSGNVVFENVTFTGGAYYGDNFTQAVYSGWTEDLIAAAKTNGKIATSLTFGQGVSFVTAGDKAVLGAVGFDAKDWETAEGVSLAPADTTAAFIIDGANVTKAGARIGTAPVSYATVELRSGEIEAFMGDDGAGTVANVKHVTNDILIKVTGGNVTKFVRPLKATYSTANVTVDISGNPTIASVLASEFSKVKGESVLKISGGTFNGEVHGSTSELATRNTISGGTFNGAFFGLGKDSSRKVINNITGGTFNAAYFGGHAEAGYIRGVSNTIKGGAFKSTFHGGNRDGVIYGTVNNEFNGGTYVGSIFAGNANGTIQTGIRNTVVKGSGTEVSFHGGNEDGLVTGGISNEISGSSFGGNFNCGSYAGTVDGNILNNVKGGTFGTVSLTYQFAGGSYSGIITGDVTTKVSKGTFYGYVGGMGCPEEKKDSVIEGSVTNNISSGTFKYRKDLRFAYMGGSFCGIIKGGIINNIENGNFDSAFIGGSYCGDLNPETWDTGLNKYGHSITTVINNGDFTNGNNAFKYFECAGSYAGASNEGEVNTTINGGTFHDAFGFGSRIVDNSTAENPNGKYVGVINGGTFNRDVFGGNYGYGLTIDSDEKKLPYESSSLTITGGTFRGDVYAGGSGNLYSNGTKSEINVVPIKESATLTIDPKSDLTFLGIVKSRNVKEIVTLKASKDHNIYYGTNSSLSFSIYEGEGQKFKKDASFKDFKDGALYLSMPKTVSQSAYDFEGLSTLSASAANPTNFYAKLNYSYSDGTKAQVNESVKKAMDALETSGEAVGNKLDINDVTDIPIANDEMTNDEVRQIVVNFFKLQLSFHWMPSTNITHYPSAEAAGFTTKNPKTVDTDTLYGGTLYQSTGTGNLYRWMEYYDENTGIVYLDDALNANGGYDNAKLSDGSANPAANISDNKYSSLKVMFNQCSVASAWGWMRVVNSANFGWTQNMNAGRNFIPVGFYTYSGYRTTYNDSTATLAYLDAEGNTLYTVKLQTKKDENGNTVRDENGDTVFDLVYSITDPAELQAAMDQRVKVTALDIADTTTYYGTGENIYPRRNSYGNYNGQMAKGTDYLRNLFTDPVYLESQGLPNSYENEYLYEIFAQAKAGDLLVHNGHAAMVKDATVVRDENGRIDPEQSHLDVLEMICGWGFNGFTKDGVVSDPMKEIVLDDELIKYKGNNYTGPNRPDLYSYYSKDFLGFVYGGNVLIYKSDRNNEREIDWAEFVTGATRYKVQGGLNLSVESSTDDEYDGEGDSNENTNLETGLRGRDGWSFEYLKDKHYFPYTFAEYHRPYATTSEAEKAEEEQFWIDLEATYTKAYGEERAQTEIAELKSSMPIEGGYVKVTGSNNKVIDLVPTMDNATISKLVISSNYTMSDLFLKVVDAEGNLIKEYVMHCNSAATKGFALTSKLYVQKSELYENKYVAAATALNEFAGKGYYLEISAQISTGELLDAIKVKMK